MPPRVGGAVEIAAVDEAEHELRLRVVGVGGVAVEEPLVSDGRVRVAAVADELVGHVELPLHRQELAVVDAQEAGVLPGGLAQVVAVERAVDLVPQRLHLGDLPRHVRVDRVGRHDVVRPAVKLPAAAQSTVVFPAKLPPAEQRQRVHLVARHEVRPQQQKADADAVKRAADVGHVGRPVRPAAGALEDVEQEEQADEVERRDVDDGHEQEQQQDGDAAAREQDQVRPRDRRDRAAGAQDGSDLDQRVRQPAGEDAAGVKAGIGGVAELVVEVVAEDVEEHHVPEQVPEVGVQERAAEEAEQRRVTRPQQQRLGECRRALLDEEDRDVERDDREVHDRRAAERAVGMDRQEHAAAGRLET